MSRPTTILPLRWIALAIVMVPLLDFLGIVGFRYPRLVPNQPLTNPVTVLAADQRQLRLTDGRVIVANRFDTFTTNDVAEIVANAGGEVDVEDIPDGEVEVFVRTPTFICGLPWLRVIQIPLFPEDIPAFERRHFAFGKVQARSDDNSQ